MQRIEASLVVSISDLKEGPDTILKCAGDEAVTVLNHNRVIAYMVPAGAYEAMLERLDDLALVEVARASAYEKPVRVSLDEL